jgi:hypothetical protein
MHGSGTFFDARLSDQDQYPVAARAARQTPRHTRSRDRQAAGAALLPARDPCAEGAQGRFDVAAAARGKEAVQRQRAMRDLPRAAALHRARGQPALAGRAGIDSFQADRSPTHSYRTAPLAGLWTHQKGGFYHDGRFPNLAAVIDHYDRNFRPRAERAGKSRADRVP